MPSIIRIDFDNLEDATATLEQVTDARKLTRRIRWELDNPDHVATASDGVIRAGLQAADDIVQAFAVNDTAGAKAARNSFFAANPIGNFAVGLGATSGITTGTGNIAIGGDALADVTSQSNQFEICG